ncbi:MAG: HAD family hydrolase [Finegoldia sp.]|uniref:HAD family hydrolase n=1 Tax=Finegoldia sp. TaxID=1981334 RepID=UPI003992A424
MKAVIFDMDGVIIDSEVVYIDFFKKVLEDFDVEISEEDLFSLAGLSQQKTDEFLESKLHRKPEEVYNMMKNYIDADKIDYSSLVMDGFYPLLKELKRKNFKLALASSSPKNTIKLVLEELKIEDEFDAVISGEDFVESKPNPEIYTNTCEILGVRPQDAFAIEDSDYGIESAKNAGLTVIARREDRFNFKQNKADFIVDNLQDIKLILEKFEKGKNGVYKIRRKSKEFVKAMFFIDKETFNDDLDDCDIYCLYRNDKMKSAIIKKYDNIVYKKVESDLDYKLILEEIENKEIDEIR